MGGREPDVADGASEGHSAQSSPRLRGEVREALGKLNRSGSHLPPLHIIDNIWIAEDEESVQQMMYGCSLLVLVPLKRPKAYRTRNLEDLKRKRRRPLAVHEYSPEVGLSSKLLSSHIPLFFDYSSRGAHICIIAPHYWVGLQAICAWLADSDPGYFPTFMSQVSQFLPESAILGLEGVYRVVEDS